MFYEKEPASWVTVKCPVCRKPLGSKRKDEIKSFTCHSEGCSEAIHTFYPGQVRRPGKSSPWSKSHKYCRCTACQARQKEN